MIQHYLKKAKKDKYGIHVPIEDFDLSFPMNYQELQWLLISLYWQAKNEGLTYLISLNYDGSEIIFKEMETMNQSNEFCIEIPYKNREDYIDFVYEINNTVDSDGVVILYVNNIPYYLKSYLVIKCSKENVLKVDKLLQKYKLENSTEKGINEFFIEQGNRMWNSISFIPNIDRKTAEMMYLSLFQLPSEKELEERGYINSPVTRKKVFISYSWKDEETILPLIKELERRGTNVFIDRQSIDYGDKLIEKIMSGLADCHIALIFLSENFKTSYMAKHELSSMWNYIIYQTKKWILVKIDGVDPNSIYPSLGDYKYFDLKNENIESLYKSIQKKLND